MFGYALPPRGDCLYRRAKPPVSGECLADIRSGAALERALLDFEPQLVFHLAAHSYIDGSYTKPRDIFETNLMGTVELLEVLRKSGGGIPVVVVSSDKCYAREMKGRPCLETDPLGAAEAYSTSKACQDLAAQSYRFSFPQMAIAAARASNTAGGGDFNKARLIPYLLDCFARGETARLRSPKAVRPWQYVLDVLWGYLTLGQALKERLTDTGSAYNFGPAPDGFQTVEQVTALLARHFPNARCQWREGGGSTETAILRLDSGKARRELGWEPLYSLEKAMDRTAAFHRGLEKRSAAHLCREEVEAYVECLQRAGENNERSEDL